jgi:hypothetical protein
MLLRAQAMQIMMAFAPKHESHMYWEQRMLDDFYDRSSILDYFLLHEVGWWVGYLFWSNSMGFLRMLSIPQFCIFEFMMQISIQMAYM